MRIPEDFFSLFVFFFHLDVLKWPPPRQFPEFSTQNILFYFIFYKGAFEYETRNHDFRTKSFMYSH